MLKWFNRAGSQIEPVVEGSRWWFASCLCEPWPTGCSVNSTEIDKILWGTKQLGARGNSVNVVTLVGPL